MVNRDVVAAKLTDLAMRVGRVRAHAKTSDAELAQDQDALDLISFNLMLAIQVCADLASHIVADEGWPAARTVGEAFTRLAEQGVLAADTAQAMARAAGFRDVVAHGYANVDVGIVQRASTDGVADIDAFAREVAGWIGRRSPA